MPKKTATLEQICARDGARVFRAAEVGAIDVGARTVELAFSSEAEVERWFGVEILSHAPGAVVTTRLADGAPLLLEHDRDKQIGIVQTVSIDADRRGRAVVRFGRSARAEEVFQDVADGIRRHVSVGYRIHDAKCIEQRGDDDVWEVTKWEPFEISIVSVPADISVGIGRSASEDQSMSPVPATTKEQPKESNMNLKRTDKAETAGAETSRTKAATADAVSPFEEYMPRARIGSAESRDLGNPDFSNREYWEQFERGRAIRGLAQMYGAEHLADAAIQDGVSVPEFQRRLLDHLVKRPQVLLTEQTRASDIGMTDREVRNYSFLRVIRALVDPTNRQAQKDAAFEFEASRAAAEKAGKQPEGVMVPSDVLARALNTATTGSSNGDTGGNLVANTLLASSFIDMLRNRSTILRLGTVVGSLVGNVDIPKQTAGGQGYWVGEAENAPETNQTFGQVPINPKTAAAYTEITRRLLKQSSLDVEGLVRSDLALALALTIDKAGYYGTGSDKQPRGIAKTTGVNAVPFAAEMPTFAELVSMETEISVDNADVASMAYVAGAHVRGHAKTTLKHEGVGGTIWEPGNSINGYRVEITNQIEKGHVFMGNFADLVVAMWGGLELNVDPYSNSKNGGLRLIAFQDIDFALRRPESFCVGKHS